MVKVFVDHFLNEEHGINGDKQALGTVTVLIWAPVVAVGRDVAGLFHTMDGNTLLPVLCEKSAKTIPKSLVPTSKCRCEQIRGKEVG